MASKYNYAPHVGGRGMVGGPIGKSAMAKGSSLKRKRTSPAEAIHDAAQRKGNPHQSALMDSIHRSQPKGARVANQYLYIPHGRTGSKHMHKVSPSFQHRGNHVHDLFSRYAKGRSRNGLKAHKNTYFPN